MEFAPSRGGGDVGEASVGRSWVGSQLNRSPDAWVESCPGPTFLERPFHSSGTRGVVREGVGGRLVDGMERPRGPGGGVALTATWTLTSSTPETNAAAIRRTAGSPVGLLRREELQANSPSTQPESINPTNSPSRQAERVTESTASAESITPTNSPSTQLGSTTPTNSPSRRVAESNTPKKSPSTQPDRINSLSRQPERINPTKSPSTQPERITSTNSPSTQLGSTTPTNSPSRRVAESNTPKNSPSTSAETGLKKDHLRSLFPFSVGDDANRGRLTLDGVDSLPFPLDGLDEVMESPSTNPTRCGQGRVTINSPATPTSISAGG